MGMHDNTTPDDVRRHLTDPDRRASFALAVFAAAIFAIVSSAFVYELRSQPGPARWDSASNESMPLRTLPPNTYRGNTIE
jgi:hypothetical protein